MSRNEAFEQAKKERLLQEANRGAGKFEKCLNSALPTNKKECLPENSQWAQLRCLGNPADFRGGDPTAAKRYMKAEALADNGKKMFWMFPSKTDDSHWAWRIVNTVLARSWDEKNKGYIYHNTDRAIFSKAFDNGTGNKMDKGWMPKDLVMLNVIDRSMMAVHRELKQCAILCSGASEMQNGSMFYNSGIPKMLYEMIWKIVEAADDYNDYDILVKKTPVNPFYEVKHLEEARFAVGAKPLLEYGTAALTEEELSWERWNIDTRTQVTSATKALKRMEKLFNEVDITFKTHFVEELRDLAAKEAEEKLAAAQNGATETDDDDDETGGEPTVATQAAPQTRTATPVAPQFPEAAPVAAAVPVRGAPAAVEAQPPVRTRAAAVDPIFGHPIVGNFPGVVKLTAEEKSWAESVNEDGLIHWIGGGAVTGCPDCGYSAPQQIHCCPNCGLEFTS